MEKEPEYSKISQTFKWIGYLTAMFSLIATVMGVAKYAFDRAETKKHLAALLAAENEQQTEHDYQSAWETLAKAAQLDPRSVKVQAAQRNLAMAWLEDVHLHENQKFSDVTQQLEPVLTQAVAASKPGPEKADLRAHIGWAYFLESRDGRSDLDPEVAYREAIAENPQNPYAEAMLGHWILWQNCGRIKEASEHFAAALSSQRQTDYVRLLELTALLNCHNDQADWEVIRVANAMRKEQRTVDQTERQQILSIYYGELVPETTATLEFINAVPPSEHVATFRWLFAVLDSDPDDADRWSRAYFRGTLEEAAEMRDDALSDYRSSLSHTSRGTSLWQAANAGVKRLSKQR
ncbi:MAG TPA: hypothetical protein VNV41_04205 [Candidatus Acidoferrales bacterium]|jgi:tetratricopeptide (TPR) repeat protein|nr:hypothetical protein [Candidatus Acidoferrales bacterium]